MSDRPACYLCGVVDKALTETDPHKAVNAAAVRVMVRFCRGGQDGTRLDLCKHHSDAFSEEFKSQGN